MEEQQKLQPKDLIIHPVTVIILGVFSFGLTIDKFHSWTLGFLGLALIITGIVMAVRKWGDN